MAISDYPDPASAVRAGDPEAVAQFGAWLRASTPIDQLVRQDYPQMAWVLANPELAPILRTASQERWDPARLMGAIEKTQWWQTTDANQREWQRLTNEDPQSAKVKLYDQVAQIDSLAQRLGVGVTQDDLFRIGTSAAAEGWDQNRLTQEVMRLATTYNPNGTGDVNAMMQNVKTRSSDFYQPMSDDTAFSWAKNILTGAASKDGLDTLLRQQAVNRFSGDKSVVEALSNGATTKEIFDPYVQQTAQLLETSPDQVNLMDQQWGNMIDGMRSDGTRRPMTLSEAATYVKGTDAWKGTAQAGQQAAGLAETIEKTFGAVA